MTTEASQFYIAADERHKIGEYSRIEEKSSHKA